MKIRIAGFDPSTVAWGTAICLVDSDTLEIEVANLILTKTESEKKQGVDKSSDDLRRAQEQYRAVLEHTRGCALVVSEVPFMTPNGYAAANFNAGMVLGILASSLIPLIQVRPLEVKRAAVGHTGACKEEMIEWGISKYPNAPWITVKRGGKRVPTAANEHLADAIAVVHAGIKTTQFRQAMDLFRSMEAKAA